MSGKMPSRALRTMTVLVALSAAFTAWTAVSVLGVPPAANPTAHGPSNGAAGDRGTPAATALASPAVYGVEASIYLGPGTEPVGLAYDSANQAVYVTDSQTNELSVISTVYESVTGTIPVGFFPVAAAYDSSNLDVYVADFAQNSVSVVSTATSRSVANISVGVAPDAVAFDNVSGNLYIANEGSNNTTIIEGSTNHVIGSIPVGVNPVAIAYDYADNEVFVANENSSNVTVISAADNDVVGMIPVGQEPLGLALDPATDNLYVTNERSDNVSVVHASNEVAVTSVSVGHHPVGLAYDAALGVVVVANDGSNDTTLIYGSNNSIAGTVAVGVRPVGVAYAPDNGYAYVANAKSDNTTVIGTPSIPPYAVDFMESGLPTGASWTVTLQGTPQTSTTSTDAFSRTNGSYSFAVTPFANYSVTPLAGSVTVAGFPEFVNVTFTLVRYAVNFTESGLPSGALWTVTLGGTQFTSSTSSAVFALPNGSYAYTVGSYSGYTVSPSSGWANVTGGNLAIAVTFTSVPPSSHSSTVGGIPLWEIAVIVVAIAAVVLGVLLSLRRARPPASPSPSNPPPSSPPTGPGTS